MPIVRSPCTLEWPRTGQAPAPGLPMAPRSSSVLVSSWMVATAWRCWVSPIAQQMMIRSRPAHPTVQLVDRAAIEAGGRQQDVGIEPVEVGAQLVEPVAVGIDERLVEGGVVVHQAAVEQLEQRQVGADHDRQVQVGERGAAAEHAADPSAGCGTPAARPPAAG